MSENNTSDYGTRERQRKGSMAIGVAEVSRGGQVISTRIEDTEHCYLDYMRKHGSLKGRGERQFDVDRRYDTGYKLRQLYYRFNNSHRVLGFDPTVGCGAGYDFIQEGDIGDESDVAETLFNEVMRQISNPNHRRIVRYICLEEITPAPMLPEYQVLCRAALDQLEAGFKRANRIINEKINSK